MQLIETIEVGSAGSASIEFTSIPQDGVDLMLLLSLRINAGGQAKLVQLRLNNDSGSKYSNRWISGTGTAVTYNSDSSQTSWRAGYATGISASSSTFGNQSILIPNYSASNNKTFSTEGVSENNATEAWQDLATGVATITDAISSVQIFYIGANILQYSTASLYKITAD